MPRRTPLLPAAHFAILGLSLFPLASAHAAPDARTAYIERSAVLALDRACHMLTPNSRAALESATYQARGALIRAGAEPKAIDGEARGAAKKAAALDCFGKDAATIAHRVQAGFSGWVVMREMSFPGDVRAWKAERNPYDGWMVSQTLDGGARFGIKKLQTGAVIAALELPAGAAGPASARLVLRNPAIAPEAVLMRDVAGGASIAKALAGRMPPPGAQRAFYAAERIAPAAATKRSPASGLTFRFSGAALDALSRLDPREAAAIVLEPANGAGAEKTLLIEAGDLSAARAFVSLEVADAAKALASK